MAKTTDKTKLIDSLKNKVKLSDDDIKRIIGAKEEV